MAVILSLDEFEDSRRKFEQFFFSHVTLIEGHLARLKRAIEACASQQNVTESIMNVSLGSLHEEILSVSLWW